MSWKDQPKPNMIMLIVRQIVVAIRGAAMDRMIEITTAAKNTKLLFMTYVHLRKIRLFGTGKYVHEP